MGIEFMWLIYEEREKFSYTLILLNIRSLFLPVTLDVTTPDWATLETEDYSTTTTTGEL